MAPHPRRLLVFGIGLPHSGGRLLQALFEGNGLRWLHHGSGKLAQDIAYCRATSSIPLQPWPKIVGFSGLYSNAPRHLPLLSVQSSVAYLHASFPEAYFIHTHQDPQVWINTRFAADNGAECSLDAWHAGIPENDLPNHWRLEQADHRAACAQEFHGSHRYLNFNITRQDIGDVINFLSDAVELHKPDLLPDYANPPAMAADAARHNTTPPDPRPPLQKYINFKTQVIDFCMQTEGDPGKFNALSKQAVRWVADGTVTDAKNRPVPLVRDGAQGSFLLGLDAQQFKRAQGALNTLSDHGAKPPLAVDMLDARFIGGLGERPAPARTIVYNRRKGARNLTLWPLPGYHTLAPQGTAGGFPKDTIEYKDKIDRCVWLGNMTGRMSPALTPEGRELRGVYAIRNQAEPLNDTDPLWQQIIADLCCVPRYNIVRTYRKHPDFVVGLVLRAKWKAMGQTPAFTGLSVPFRPREWFHQYRYILSLSGNDTGSNFLSAAASNALILKEEDGWELFYTDAFKPWVHYVPLEEGAQDVEEKLAWARANPDKSAAMARAATDMFDRFADPSILGEILRGIATRLNAGLD